MPEILTCTIWWPAFGNIDNPLFLLSVQCLNTKTIMNGVLCHICVETLRFFEKYAQNLNTPQNNSASWDLQMGFNSACKGLKWIIWIFTQKFNLRFTNGSPWNRGWHFGTLTMLPLVYLILATLKPFFFLFLHKDPTLKLSTLSFGICLFLWKLPTWTLKWPKVHLPIIANYSFSLQTRGCRVWLSEVLWQRATHNIKNPCIFWHLVVLPETIHSPHTESTQFYCYDVIILGINFCWQ